MIAHASLAESECYAKCIGINRPLDRRLVWIVLVLNRLLYERPSIHIYGDYSHGSESNIREMDQ